MNLEKRRYGDITLYLTYNCNLNCSYCFCGKKFTKDMSIEMLEKIIGFYNEVCTEDPTITFFGGEPLLKMDLIKHTIKLNNELYDRKFKFSITTNGTLLDKETYQYLKANNVHILLSLDGNKESHNLNRKFCSGEGSWDVIMHNISDFCDELPVRMTFSKATLANLYDDVKSLIEYGFKSIAFYPASGALWDQDDYKLFEEQIKLLMDYFYICYCNGKCVDSHWIDKSISRHIIQDMSSCAPGINQMSVTPEGYIFPCNHTNFTDRLLEIGNIYDGINEEKVLWINEQIQKVDDECHECALKNRCNYCYINMYEETKKLWRIPDWFCILNQIVIINSDLLAARLYQENNPTFMKKFYKKEVY